MGSAIKDSKKKKRELPKKEGELCAGCWKAKQEWVVKWLKVSPDEPRVYVCGHKDATATRVGRKAGLVDTTAFECPSGNIQLNASEKKTYRAHYVKAQRAGDIQRAFESVRSRL